MRTSTETVVSFECVGWPRCTAERFSIEDGQLVDSPCCKKVEVARPTREALEGEITAPKRENRGLRSALVAAQNASRRGW
jgi:hypothetical protein